MINVLLLEEVTVVICKSLQLRADRLLPEIPQDGKRPQVPRLDRQAARVGRCHNSRPPGHKYLIYMHLSHIHSQFREEILIDFQVKLTVR